MPTLCARQAQPENSRDTCKVGKPVHSPTASYPFLELVLHFIVLFGSHYLASHLAGPSQSTATKHAAVLSPDKQEPASSDLHTVNRSDN